jgi:hydroxymethylpyrimidine/phosphomethylpyrimidine kinase
MKTALTIAGLDPTGGAGLQADLRTFAAMGVYGISVPTVLTAQNTDGVHSVHEVSSGFFSTELEILLNDIKPDALKTGMIFNIENVEIIADTIARFGLKNLVVDPVTVSSTGVSLVQDGMLDALKKHLIPLARVITPNIYEASVLTGMKVENENEMKEVAKNLHTIGPEAVVVTGGHLKDRAIDILFDGNDIISLESEMLEGTYHGTGCVFSSVITAGLALGYGVKESFVKAKEFVWNGMNSALSLGKGMKILGF